VLTAASLSTVSQNPDNPAAAHQFHLLSVAQAILLDAPQRAKYDAKAEEKQRKEARLEGFASRKRGLVSVCTLSSFPPLASPPCSPPSSPHPSPPPATPWLTELSLQDLVAREEAFKKSREDAAKNVHFKAAESAVQSEGRQLREAAQAAKLAADEFARMELKRAERESLNSRARAREAAKEGAASAGSSSKEVGAADRTLRLSLPLPEFASVTTSSATLEAHLRPTYGQIAHSLLRAPTTSTKSVKKGKAKEVVSAVLEFTPDNLAGCWALVEDCRLARGLNSKGGVKAKWAAGEEPEWVARLGSQSTSTAAPPPPPPATGSAAPSGPSAPRPPPAPSNTAPSAPSFSFDPAAASLPSFGSAPSSTSTADYENATLLRMRQAERERIEREIREADELEE